LPEVRAWTIGVALLAVSLPVAVATIGEASAKTQSRQLYSVQLGGYRDVAHFQVTYSGSGKWATTYHSEPPTRGGPPDTNDASDSSAQRWGVTFARVLSIPRCGRPREGVADPCTRLPSLKGAKGTARATGRVAHIHRDGLFPNQNASVRCRIRAVAPVGMRLTAEIRLRYAPRSRSFAVTALTPIADALTLLPVQCPGQGDSIDGLFDNYFLPGFSFSSGFGPERWFTAPTIVIPTSVLHRATHITVPLGNARAGTPPANCAVKSPEFERCATGGSWTGVLTFASVR
jgi:hypothetical protein